MFWDVSVILSPVVILQACSPENCVQCFFGQLTNHNSGSQLPQRTVARIINQALLKLHQWSYPLRSARSYTISQIYLFKLLLQKRKLPKCGSTWAKVELLQSKSQPHKTRFWDQLVGYTLAMMQLNKKHVHGKSRANRPFKAHQYVFSQFIFCDMTVVLVEQPNATYHLRHFQINRQIILTHD